MASEGLNTTHTHGSGFWRCDRQEAGGLYPEKYPPARCLWMRYRSRMLRCRKSHLWPGFWRRWCRRSAQFYPHTFVCNLYIACRSETESLYRDGWRTSCQQRQHCAHIQYMALASKVEVALNTQTKQPQIHRPPPLQWSPGIDIITL